MSGRLQDRVAIVSGAGSSGPGWGNGKAAAVLFAREGAKVVCVDLVESAAAETASLIADEGGAALVQRVDVTRSDQIAAMVKATLARFGRIDVLHNNVGIVEVGGAIEASEASWRRVMDVNLTSMFLTCKHVLPVMVRQFEENGRGGAIVNVSSVAAIRYSGVPYVSYSASKAAIIQLTRTTALEYAAKGVRANTILPGLMNTPMIREPLKGVYGDIANMIEQRDAQCPMGHMGDAWDVAHAALFLASDEARYITATELRVDGGISGGIGG